ncbi:MAG: hypothetical protein OEQ53_16320, partial [Saprospiraceae bacterium]|nr:hypothetical protein [Saprospiraceae bacterium]
MKETDSKRSGTGLIWFWSRLQTMQSREILAHISLRIQKIVERLWRAGRWERARLVRYPEPIFHPLTRSQSGDMGDPLIFGTPLSIADHIDWHYDIISQKRFPQRFSYDIDTRSGYYGIVKVVWEINRMQYLPDICQRFRDSGDQVHMQQFTSIIESWRLENPYLLGVNWYSSTEAALRIITWLFCWEILEATDLVKQNQDFADFTNETWIPLIYQHGLHIDRHPSKYSSANNHLIAEGCGLFLVGTYWSFSQSPRWKRKAKTLLEREILTQHSENGINREEASEYIQFITDFFLLAYLVGLRTGSPFSTSYAHALQKIMSRS